VIDIRETIILVLLAIKTTLLLVGIVLALYVSNDSHTQAAAPVVTSVLSGCATEEQP